MGNLWWRTASAALYYDKQTGEMEWIPSKKVPAHEADFSRYFPDGPPSPGGAQIVYGVRSGLGH